MTIKELRDMMPTGYILVDSSLKGRKNFHGFNHVYVVESGRVYLTYGLAWAAHKKNLVSVLDRTFNTHLWNQKDITDNYKSHPQGPSKLAKLGIILK